MATRTLVSEQPKADRPTPATDRGLPHPAWLGLVSGALLWLSFPPAEWSGAAWIALAPLFLLIDSQRPRRSVYLGAWVGGLAFWLLAIQWIWATDESAWLGWVVMAGFLSTWWPAFLFLARFARRRLGLPTIVAAPVLWVALEYIRAFILTGFPWYYVSHSQYKQIYWTQIADFSGALGLSFLMVVVSALVVDLITLPLFRGKPGGSPWARLALPQRVRLIVVGAGVLGTLAYGAYRVSSAEFRDGPRVAMLQSNEVIRYNSDQARSPAENQANLEALIGNAISGAARPDLIVWPETSYPWGFSTFEVGLDRDLLNSQVKDHDPKSVANDWLREQSRVDRYFEGVMAATGVPMMVGSSIYEFKRSGSSRFNSAILFRPGLPIQLYNKIHLVPFGEYVPLLKALPWLIRLTPFRGTKSRFLDHGAKPAWFDLGPYRLAPAICFEDTVPHLIRRSFSEAPDGRQPDLLVNLSNDGWFHATAEHEMHLAVSVFRCIENRVPLARAVNTGISAMIDGNGRIVESLGKLKRGVLTTVAPLDDRVSFYSRWGDWLGQFCLAATIGLLVLGTFAPRGPGTQPIDPDARAWGGNGTKPISAGPVGPRGDGSKPTSSGPRFQGRDGSNPIQAPVGWAAGKTRPGRPILARVRKFRFTQRNRELPIRRESKRSHCIRAAVDRIIVETGSINSFRIPMFPKAPSLSIARVWCRFTQVEGGLAMGRQVVVHPRLVVDRLARPRPGTLSLMKASRRGICRRFETRPLLANPHGPNTFLRPTS